MSFQSNIPQLQSSPFEDYHPYLTFDDVTKLTENGLMVGLFKSGCVDQSGRRNCTAVCTDPALLYGNAAVDGYTMKMNTNVSEVSNTTAVRLNLAVPYNIFNCLYYPYISSLLTDESASTVDRQAAQSLAAEFDIRPNAATEICVAPDGTDAPLFDGTIAQTISQVQWNCVTTYCWVKDCDSQYSPDTINTTTWRNNITQLGPGMSRDLNGTLSFPRWNLISTRESMNVYGDVAGIGVSIAFMIQALTIALSWLYVWTIRYRGYLRNLQNKRFIAFHLALLKPFSSNEQIRRLSTTLSQPLLGGPNVGTKSTKRLKGIQDAKDIILDTMSDFQKAQCFFLLSLNVAMLAGLFQKGALFASTDLGQYWNNVRYTVAIAQGTIAFATFQQYCLHAANKTSTYLVLLVLCTFSIGVTTLIYATRKFRAIFSITTLGPRLDLDLANPITENWQSYCGMIAPRTYNGVDLRIGQLLGRFPDIGPDTFGNWIIAFGSAIVFGLLSGLIIRAWYRARKQWLERHSKPKRHSTVISKKRTQLPKTKSWFQWPKRICYALVELCIWLWVIAFIVLVWYPLGSVMPINWTIGQILAVSIWVPGLIDWFHALSTFFKPAAKEKLYRLLRMDLSDDMSTRLDMKSATPLSPAEQGDPEMAPLSAAALYSNPNPFTSPTRKRKQTFGDAGVIEIHSERTDAARADTYELLSRGRDA